MSATVESPVPWRRAAAQFVSNGLFRSRSTHFDLTARTRAPDVEVVMKSGSASRRPGDGVFERQADHGVAVNGGIWCSPTGSPSPRRRAGLSSHLNKFCHQLQINMSSIAIPTCLRPERSRLLSQSSDALSDIQQVSQTAPVIPTKPVLPEPKRASAGSPALCSFSAPVKGSAATVVVTAGIQDTEDGSTRTSIPSVRCELVAGLVNESSVADQLLVIDCRSFVAYNSNHVLGALNISCSDCISRKRLLTGRVTVGDLVSGADDAKGRYHRAAELAKSGNKNAVQVIVYDEDTINYDELPCSSPLRLVVSCLLKAGFDVYYLFGK